MMWISFRASICLLLVFTYKSPASSIFVAFQLPTARITTTVEAQAETLGTSAFTHSLTNSHLHGEGSMKRPAYRISSRKIEAVKSSYVVTSCPSSSLSCLISISSRTNVGTPLLCTSISVRKSDLTLADNGRHFHQNNHPELQ
jgi:hypothetical protein